MKKILVCAVSLLVLAVGVNAAQEQKLSKDGVYIDSKQNLMWQDNQEAITIMKYWWIWDPKIDNGYLDTSGDTAATYCENSILAGYNDWRLPTIEELNHLYSDKKNLKHVASSYYWSSTTDENYERDAFVVYFGDGSVDSYGKRNRERLRCVRNR